MTEKSRFVTRFLFVFFPLSSVKEAFQVFVKLTTKTLWEFDSTRKTNYRVRQKFKIRPTEHGSCLLMTYTKTLIEKRQKRSVMCLQDTIRRENCVL